MKALLIGATGATGKDLVTTLLQDSYYTEIVTFVRRPTGITHPNLFEVVTDFDQLEEVSGFINGDIWFSCLGTTLKTAGSKENQRHIDYEIPANFARIAKRNGVSRAVLLSAYGASATSNVFYSNIKGQLEDTIGHLAFEQYIIFRPGLLLRKDSDRFGERLSAGVLNFLNGLKVLTRFQPLPTSTLAAKLAKAPKILPAGTHVIELDQIARF
ncbi:NAD(P)H-binding protein [Larkinella terrae]|uniref:NAD(P)H-binding protein n=1 Tax=Larkinella terrae TaxID=2025311 RepID=A0A7K0EEG6_9BACT|nr:NAD(P)H-binding protein [Larkinella terrae]MRS60223.1 NAD(P)H-binding protein [Larkinella terrae]